MVLRSTPTSPATLLPRLFPRLLVGLLLAGGLASCGADGGAPDPDEGEDLTAPVDASGQPLEPQPIDPATVGTIRGVALFQGTPPERRPIGTGGIPACEVHDGPLLTETVLVQDGRLANVFVHVKEGLAGWEIPPPPPGEHVVDQRGCVYLPHVSAMRAGQVLVIKNSDAETHNVNIRAPKNDASDNLIQGPNGADARIELTRREYGIQMRCDLHPWMRAYLHVCDHPFFDVTAADGTFELPGLPPGTYTLQAIHEEYRRQRAEVVVRAGEVTQVEFVYSE